MYNPWRELLVFSVVTVILNVLFTVIYDGSDPEIDYYVKLISEEIEKSNNYVLPEDASEFRGSDSEIKDFGTYDFIVIGGGSAGAVAAARLSEVRNWTVLLLEAGTYGNDFINIPAMFVYVMRSDYNWGYKSVPQTTACLGMVERRCPFPRGRGFGGTSLINGLIYSRGHQLDFDLWAKQGNPGWSYEEVLPFFKKSENVNIDDAEPQYHGKEGPLNVEYYKPYSPQFKAFVDANLELGRRQLDYNGREELGVSRTQLNTLNGTRHSTSRAFLYPVMHRKNLKLQPYSYVTKILVDKFKTAYGVEFASNGTRYRVRASMEVILSAGAIASPQLLMLSGVGPESHLKMHRIPVIQNLAVGRSTDDHPGFYGLNILSNSSEPIGSLRQHVQNYLSDHGIFTIPAQVQGLGFFQSELANITGYPDVEIMIVPSNRTSPLHQKFFRFTNATAEALWGNINSTSTFTFFVIVLHPVSRGTIELKSNDPFEYPLIDPNFLSDTHDHDIQTMYKGIQLVIQMLNTTAMRKINATLGKVVHEDCRGFEYLSVAYWYCTIRRMSMNVFHPISGCKMGPDPNNGAVVDAKLRVHGIKRLRVADTSIIPFSLSGHPNAVAIMIGERVADFIKRKYVT